MDDDTPSSVPNEKNVDDVFDRAHPYESANQALKILFDLSNIIGFNPDETKRKKAAFAYARQSVQTLNFITACCEEALDRNDFTLIQDFMRTVIHDRTRHTSTSIFVSKPWEIAGPAKPRLKINQAHDDFLMRFKQKTLADDKMDLAVDCNLYHWEMNLHAGKDFLPQASFQMRHMYLLLEQNDYEAVYYHCRDYLRLAQPLSFDKAQKSPHNEYLFIARRAMYQACEKKNYSIASKILFAFRSHPLEREDFDLAERCKRNVQDPADALRCNQLLYLFYEAGRVVTDAGFLCRGKLYKEIRAIGDRALLDHDNTSLEWSLRLQVYHLEKLIHTVKAYNPGDALTIEHEKNLAKTRLEKLGVYCISYMNKWRATVERLGIPNDNEPGDIRDEDYRDDMPFNRRPRDRDPDDAGSYTAGGGSGKPRPAMPPNHAAVFAKPALV